jgi:hypothetical protein
MPESNELAKQFPSEGGKKSVGWLKDGSWFHRTRPGVRAIKTSRAPDAKVVV